MLYAKTRAPNPLLLPPLSEARNTLRPAVRTPIGLPDWSSEAVAVPHG